MHYASIKNFDIANGEGCRVTLFVSGCTNCCEGCFQPETWDFYHGQLYTKETENQIINLLRNQHIDGITLLGGEPFEPTNQIELVKLLRRFKQEFPERMFGVSQVLSMIEI